MKPGWWKSLTEDDPVTLEPVCAAFSTLIATFLPSSKGAMAGTSPSPCPELSHTYSPDKSPRAQRIYWVIDNLHIFGCRGLTCRFLAAGESHIPPL